MEIDNLVKERVGAFLGQRSAVPHAMLTAADCEAVKNFVSRRGRLRKIWGAPLYKDPNFGVGEIKWLDYFRHLWLFQRGNSIGIESAEGSAIFSEIGSIFGGSLRRVFSAKWTDVVFISNGFENRFIDFETLENRSLLRVGLLPPAGGIITSSSTPYAPATFSVVADASSDLPAGSFEYAVTLWDDERRVESLPYGSFVGEDGLWLFGQDILQNFTNGEIAITVGGAGNKVQIDFTPIFALGYDADRVTHYIVYRKATADGVFKRLAVVSGTYEDKTVISNPIFNDTIAEADLGAVLDVSISPPPSGKYYRDSTGVAETNDYGPRFVKYHRDQLWYFGVNFPGTEHGYDIEAAAAVRYYPLNGVAYASDVGVFDYWKYSYSIGRETGQADTFMGKHLNTLMFFKESSAYYLDGTSPENYVIRDLDSKRGIIASGSAQETTIGIIGLGEEGFTLFDSISGGKVKSDNISDMVEKINLDYADKITSAFDPVEGKYECHCPIENDRNTLVFVYDIKTDSWSFTSRAGGAAHYGLKTNKRAVGLLGDRLNGRLYTTTDRSAVTFNGQTMHGSWRSKQFDFNSPGDVKTLHAVTITARATRDFRLSIDVIPDNAQNDAVSVEDIAPDVRSDVLAEDANDAEGMLWDEGQWSNGSSKKEFTILVQAVGKKLQLIVRNSDNDANRANFEIEEIILWASLESGDDSK